MGANGTVGEGRDVGEERRWEELVMGGEERVQYDRVLG